MDDGSRCLLDVIGDPSALQSFLEEGDNLKNSPSTSLDDSPLQVDFCIRTNGSHIRTSPTLLKQAAAAAVVAGSINSFQVSGTQTVSSGISSQVVCSTQAPSPAYQQPVASPQVGQSPLGSHNATCSSTTVQSPAPSPFSVPSRSPAQPIPSPSPSTHQRPTPSQSPYQNKSPAQAPSPHPQSKSPVASLLQSPQPSPQQQIIQQQQTGVTQTLSLASGGATPVVQFVSTNQPIITSQTRNVKPIQPKQPHLLPKPATGTTNGMQFGGKQVNARNHPVTVAPSPQTNQLVIGQNQATVLPNANVSVTGAGGGTLLLNCASLGLGQNPILIQNTPGGPLQLVVRPQQTGQATAQGTATAPNTTALLAALQVQNQAAQQALLNHTKGQTMVIPTSANLLAQQQANALGKTNMIVNTTRMVNPGQQIQLQQIQTPQGPITLAITPQHLRSLQGNLTLAGAPPGTILQLPQLQGTTTLPQGVVVNRQTVTPTSVSMSDNRQQTQSVKAAPSVNLEELLKQAGIVPADTRPTNTVINSQNVVVSQPQQAVLINSAAIPTSRANSQLITQLQQPIPLAQAQAQQLKLALAQDGSVFLQRPNTGTDTSSMLMQRLNAAAPQHIHIPVSSTGTVDTGSPLLPLTVQNINLSAAPQLLTIASAVTTTATGNDGGVTTVSGLMQANPNLVQALSQGNGQLTTHQSVLAQALSQKVMTQTSASHLADQVTSTATATMTTTVMSVSQPTTSTVSIPSGTAAVIKTETTNVLLTSTPITAIPAGQKLQTIQLSPQNQENLQKIQIQLRNLQSQKNLTPQQRQMIQQLQQNQQKILAQGKVIAIQQAPASTLQLIQQQAALRPAVTTTTVAAATTKNNNNNAANVHLSNLLKQAPANVKTTNIVNSTAVTATVTVPTQIKLGNQVVTLTPQQRQTFHQLQQQLKALTPEQQQLYLSQNKQAVILKLQQQNPPTTVTSVATGGQPTPIAPAPPAIAVAASNTGSLLLIQAIGKGIAQVKSIVPAIVQDQQNRGVKRPAPTPQGSPIQQQLTGDQNGALKPDCKTPFRSVKDACRRLLKYHVFNGKTPTPSDLMQADKQFEAVSDHLLEKARKVFSTYKYLQLKESTREYPSSELLMLNELFVADEKAQLEKDKEDVKQGKDLNLPPLPEHWRHKMDAVSDDTKMSICVATTLASTCANTVTTTVHTAPLSSPSSKNKSRDNYDEWAEIKKELEIYDDEPRPVRVKQEEMDSDWENVYNRTRLSESEAAVESILLPLNDESADVDLTDIDEFEPNYAASDSGGVKSEEEDDEDEDDESKSPLVAAPPRVRPELNEQVETAINSILHLQDKEEFDEYMDEEYELEDEKQKSEEILGVVNDHVSSMEYDTGSAISLDSHEMDAALEEAVKSIM